LVCLRLGEVNELLAAKKSRVTLVAGQRHIRGMKGTANDLGSTHWLGGMVSTIAQLHPVSDAKSAAGQEARRRAKTETVPATFAVTSGT
jgi:hypothetical protein